MSTTATISPSLTLTLTTHHHHSTTSLRPHHQPTTPLPLPRLRIRHTTTTTTTTCFYKVSIQHEGQTTQLDVDEDETILEKALESGMPVPHDCKLGVCMTCPAKLLFGKVDQSEGMLSDDVIEKGYSLLCVSYPKSDCSIQIIPEEELLSLQLATADD